MFIKKRQFTLIELLVVVGVIAILMALLLPALTKAKIRARRLAELSDRKQVMMATVMYANDNSNHLPDRGTPGRAPHGLRYGSRPNVNRTFVEPYLGEGAQTRARFMFCYSALLEHPNYDPYRTDTAYRPNHWETTYNYGTIVFYNMLPGPQTAGSYYVPWFDIRKLGTAEPNRPMWGCPSFRKTSGVWFAHDRGLLTLPPEGANVVYVDGHGRWVPQKESVRWHRWYGDWYMPEDGL